jgi:hypothetical protein
MTPYPDHDFNERERWEEGEAEFCDRMVELCLKTVTEQSERLSKEASRGGPGALYLSTIAEPVLHATIRAQVWGQMADHLRRSRIARIENPR